MKWTPRWSEYRPSARETLTTAVLLDLAVRFDVLFEVLPPGISLTAGTLLGESVLSAVTTWLLFGIAFYVIAPVIYPEETGLPRTERGFRLVFTAVAVAVGASIAQVGTSAYAWASTAIGIVGGGAAFVGYLRWYHGWRITHPKYPTVRPLEQFTPFESAREEMKRDLNREGIPGAIGSSVWVTAFTVILVVPCVLAAFVAVALGYAFPLFDLLVLGWVLATMTGLDRRSWGADESSDTDPELLLLEQLRDGVRNTKGLAMVIYAVTGLIFSGGSILVGFSIGGPLLGATINGTSVTRGIWAAIGIPAGLAASGGYGIAVWYSELRRVPAYVETWVGSRPDRIHEQPPPAGHVYPAAILSLASILVSPFLDLEWVQFAFGACWPLAVLGLAWGLVRWRERNPTPVWRVDRSILRGMVVQSTLIWGIRTVDDFRAVVSGHRSPVTLVDPTYLALVTIFVLAAYVPEVHRLDDPERGGRRFLLPGYLFVFAAVNGVATITVPASYVPMLGTVAAVCAVGGVALLLVRRYEYW